MKKTLLKLCYHASICVGLLAILIALIQLFFNGGI
nr:MAG TPA: YtpI-like protein [Caudoviricetes sp.]